MMISSGSAPNGNSDTAIVIASLLLLSSFSSHRHGVHAGRALPSSFTGTRGAATVRTHKNTAAASDSERNGGWSILSTIRSLKEENRDKDRDDEDDLGDDCWGWQDDWTDDEYEACWDGTFKYELDPSGPPERCDKYDPGDNTDDWTDVCADWYAKFGECAKDGQEAEDCDSRDAPFAICCEGQVCAEDDSGQCVPHCGKEGDEAKACGSDVDDDVPEECCGDLICGDNNKCVALPTCALPETEAVGCGAAMGLYAEECCDGSICSADGSNKCVVPPPPAGEYLP